MIERHTNIQTERQSGGRIDRLIDKQADKRLGDGETLFN